MKKDGASIYMSSEYTIWLLFDFSEPDFCCLLCNPQQTILPNIYSTSLWTNVNFLHLQCCLERTSTAPAILLSWFKTKWQCGSKWIWIPEQFHHRYTQFYGWPNLPVFGERWHREKEKPSGLAQWVFNATTPFCGERKCSPGEWLGRAVW